MILISRLDKNRLTQFAINAEAECIAGGNTVFDIQGEEVISYLKVREGDSFLYIRYKGDSLDGLKDELKYVKLPEPGYGTVIILKGGGVSAQDMIRVQEIVEGTSICREWNPLLGWIDDSIQSEIEVQLITKVCDGDE